MAEVSRNAAIEIARRTEKNLQFIRAEFDRLGEDSPVHVVTQLVKLPSRDGYITTGTVP